MQSLQPGGLFGVAFYQIEESCKLRFQLLIGFAVGLKKDWIAGEQKSAKSCLFIDHQLDQFVGVGDDLISTVYPASTALHLLDSISKGQCKQAQGNDWECQQTEKQTSICCGFQIVSRGGRLRHRTKTKARMSGVLCNFA